MKIYSWKTRASCGQPTSGLHFQFEFHISVLRYMGRVSDKQFVINCNIKNMRFFLYTVYLVDFLCSICDNSDRPRSVLNTALAALSHVYRALEQQDLTKDAHIVRLTTALVKSQTVRPMKKSTVLPVDRFTEMFRSWGSNDSLSLKHLRLKAITLLALALMLRPSDVAPKATIFDANTGDIQTVLFITDMLEFRADGVKVTFFGIKNDAQRSGFEVFLPRHATPVIDPVQTLSDYITRTQSVRSDNAVFLSLKRPHKAVSAAVIGKVLKESMHLTGLSRQGFWGKTYRPTGATMAIHSGVDPHIVQKVGRWKCAEVFYQHYVHSQTPTEFASSVLSM